jgi:hypothetical protein
VRYDEDCATTQSVTITVADVLVDVGMNNLLA